jgi:hypothetical protein
VRLSYVCRRCSVSASSWPGRYEPARRNGIMRQRGSLAGNAP